MKLPQAGSTRCGAGTGAGMILALGRVMFLEVRKVSRWTGISLGLFLFENLL